MSLKQIAEQNPNVQLVVSMNDLRELFDDWQAETQRQVNNAKATPQSATSVNDLLTAAEVKQMMRVSASTLWKLEKHGELSPVRIGRRVFYRSGDIHELLKGKKKG